MRPRSPRLPVRLAFSRTFHRQAAALLAVFVLAAAGLSAMRADIQQPIDAHNAGQRLQRRGQLRDTTPANGEPQDIQIHQGETVEIVLRARGQVGKSIEFLIRSWPSHGTLEGLPRPLGRDSASITYVHREGDGPGNDVFTYAVRTTGSAVSAAVPVTVTVLDLPPSLAVTPAELDFGAVKAGDSTRATITLENRGGGMATGVVDPPAPWIVDGPAEYHLAHGETQSFQIVFLPSYGRAYVENAHFRAEEGKGVRLIGTGIGPRDPSADEPARNVASGNSIAEKIARDNALALAAGNAARAPSADEALTAARAREAAAALAANVSAGGTGGHGNAAGNTDAGAGAGVASLPSTPSAANGTGPGVAGNGTLELPTGGPDSVVLNEASVKALEARGVGTTTVDLAWNPPRPTPRSYRVELRYLSLDSDDKLRVDWRPYAKVDIHPTQSRVTARVSGLPDGTRQYVRVVGVDDDGRLAAPSPVLMFETRVAPTWFHVTPLKVLFASLLLCLGLLIYRKWEEHQILQELADSRAARDADLMYRR